MTASTEFSDAERAQRIAAATVHGMGSAFAKTHDEATLQPTQRARLAEIRDELATTPGVRDAQRRLASNVVLIFEWGMAWLADKARSDGPVAAFESPMLARFISVTESARRNLDTLERLGSADDDSDDVTAGRVLESLTHAGGGASEREQD